MIPVAGDFSNFAYFEESLNLYLSVTAETLRNYVGTTEWF